MIHITSESVPSWSCNNKTGWKKFQTRRNIIWTESESFLHGSYSLDILLFRVGNQPSSKFEIKVIDKKIFIYYCYYRFKIHQKYYINVFTRLKIK